jgi:aryl-alcohol dehydrogenase-like predicted oxidoreductase
MAFIGLGTAAIGRPLYINIRQEASTPFSLEEFRNKAWQALDKAFAVGIRYYDTAPNYGFAEQLLIDWCREKQNNAIEVATKWGYTYVANFDPQAQQHEVKDHSLSKLLEQWEQSQKLLPYLSTYQIHSATFETGVLNNEAVIEKLAQIKSAHQLKIGITSTGANQVKVIKKALEVDWEGQQLFDTFQATYNILDQSLAEISDLLLSQGKRIIIKEALANGRLFPNEQYPHYSKLYQHLKSLAKKYETGEDAIALRFCMDSLNSFTVLSGAGQKEHIEANLQAENFKLDEEEITALQAFSIPPDTYWAERKKLGWN